MGFIKHALIGIALYEVVKYFLGKEDRGFVHAPQSPNVGSAASQKLRGESVDIIAGASQTDHLKRMKENAAIHQTPANDLASLVNTPEFTSPDLDLEAGTNPNAPLTGQESANDFDDPWKKSLANDELRAPDS